MQVQIRGETKYLPVQTITLQPEETGNMYGFHCLGCGNFHQKIGGKVSKIYPIYEPSYQMPVVSKCRNCGKEYTFQTHDGYSSDKIKVILHANPGINQFYCYRGKDLLLEYSTMVVYSSVEKKNKQIPFFSPCTNADCKTVYYFSQML